MSIVSEQGLRPEFRPSPAGRAGADADVVVSCRRGVLVVRPEPAVAPDVLAAVLIAAAVCGLPVVLDLRDLLLTGTMLAAVRDGLCSSERAGDEVGLVAVRPSDRRRLRRLLCCHRIALFPTVATAVSALDRTARRSSSR